MPRAIYRWFTWTAKQQKGGKIIRLTQKAVSADERQVADYFLCWKCEDRFNKEGEDWCLKNTYRGKGRFPLRDGARQAKSHGLTLPSGVAVVPCSNVANIRIDQLIYFAISVFWRAGAHQWTQPDTRINIELGPYCEKFRRFLQGVDQLPSNINLVVAVNDSSAPLMAMVFPFKERIDITGISQHRFTIFGLTFMLQIGVIPDHLRRLCAINAGALCLAPNHNENVLRDFARMERSRRRF